MIYIIPSKNEVHDVAKDAMGAAAKEAARIGMNALAEHVELPVDRGEVRQRLLASGAGEGAQEGDDVGGGVDEATAREAMRLAATKLPIKCKFVKKEEVEQ